MTRHPFIKAPATAAMIGCLSLAACSAPRSIDVVKTVTVSVPTPVSCVPKSYAAPAAPTVTREGLRAQPDAAARYQALQAYWTMTAPLLVEQGGIIAACQAAAGVPAK